MRAIVLFTVVLLGGSVVAHAQDAGVPRPRSAPDAGAPPPPTRQPAPAPGAAAPQTQGDQGDEGEIVGVTTADDVEEPPITTAEAEGAQDTAEEPSPSFSTTTPPVAPVREPVAPIGAAATGGIPLELELHGYYRTRAVWLTNVPGPRPPGSDLYSANDAAYLFQRLRLEPSVLYGSDPEAPVAALYMQFDGLDNVVWGDNSRLAATPLFAGDPSSVDVEGFDVPSFRLERAWLQFLIPVGQVRVGRMPSQWGLGVLTSDGNGLGEWGDPMYGTTLDRLLFATRPLTIFNVLTRGDPRNTPLILAVAYDKLVEDPLGPLAEPLDAETRPVTPGGFLSNGADDVQETVVALIWNDPDVNPDRTNDELTAGFYFVNRWQESTSSDVYIYDLFWKFRYALGPRLPSLYTAGEIVTIQGSSRGISLAGGCDDVTGLCNETDADIWGGVARVGAIDANDRWSGVLELGFSSGDGVFFNDDQLTVRALHPDYHVGLLIYQVALANTTALAMGEALRPLWSRGGVWNSTYIWPQVRYELIPGVEVHGAFLLAWADELVGTIYVNNRDDLNDRDCGVLEGDCMLGWEADLALRLKWGENDILHWDTEFGLMRAGRALSQPTGDFPIGLDNRYLWTLQTRIAMVF